MAAGGVHGRGARQQPREPERDPEAQAVRVHVRRAGRLQLFKVATRRAREAGRQTFEPGDGCSNAAHSSSYRTSKYARTQAGMQAAIDEGTAERVERPVAVPAPRPGKR